MLSFPKEIVMIYAGLEFGTAFGGVINLMGLIGAFWLGFEAGRSGRIKLDDRRSQPLLQKYQRWLDSNGLTALIFLRIFPFTPNDILSISAGFSRLKRAPYMLISFIAAVPYAFFFAYIGAEQLDRFTSLFPEVFDYQTWILSFIIIIAAGIYVIRRGSLPLSQAEASL